MTLVPVRPRAEPIDLSLLAPPTIIDAIDPDQLVLAWIDDLKQRLPAWSGVFDQDPFVKACHVWAYALANKLARDNDRCRAVFLATASGADLDQIAATYYADLGLKRLVVSPATEFDAAVIESDARFRERIRLAPEAFAGTGTADGYRYWAMTAAATLIDAGVAVSDDIERRVTLTCLAPGGGGFEELAHAIRTTIRRIKPLTDVVTVQACGAAAYTIRAVIEHGPGADPSVLRVAAEERLTAVATTAARKVGAVIGTDALIAAGRVAGVLRFQLLEPAADIDPGFDKVAVATSIELTMVLRDD
jgi:phage-related baseplate assembly protein